MDNQPKNISTSKRPALEECARIRRLHLEEKVLLLHRLEGIADPAVAKVVEETFSKPLRQIWIDTAADARGNPLEDLVRVLWEPNRHLFDFEVNLCKGGIQVHVTRCLFHDVAKMLDSTDWGYQLFCTDYTEMIKAFNPEASFHCTQTLMQGSAYCDFYYFMKGQEPGPGQ